MITRFITLLWQIWKHNAIKYNTTVGKERGGWCLGLKDKTKNVQSAKFLPKVCKEQSISMHNQLTSSQVLTVTVLFVLYHCKCHKSIFTKVMQLIKNKLEKGVLETCQKNISLFTDRWTGNLSPEKCTLSGCENHKMREEQCWVTTTCMWAWRHFRHQILPAFITAVIFSYSSTLLN